MDRAAGVSPHEISATGAIPSDLCERAPLIAIHRPGRLPPLVLTQTWLSEPRHLQNLARHLGPDQPLYGISPPQGERREEYPSDVAQWARSCLPWIRAAQPGGPYRLGGWSLGGVVAFEAATLLAAEGERVERVVLFDSWVPRPQPKQARSLPHELVHYLDEMLDLPAHARIPYARAMLRRLWKRESRKLRRRREGRGEGPQGVPPLLRAIRVSYLKYAPAPSRLPVTIFWCPDTRDRAGDATLGWHPYLLGELETRAAAGAHRTLFDEPHVRSLASDLAVVLGRGGNV